LNVNLRLVALGAAAPWFYDGEYGQFTAQLNALVKRARANLGLWRACPMTRYDPSNAVATLR
jgi:endonuclease YncB( thermonuclease family)